MVAFSVWLRSNEISRRLQAQKRCAFRLAQENLFFHLFIFENEEETTASKYIPSRVSLRYGEHLLR